jgi:hypothetical protein
MLIYLVGVVSLDGHDHNEAFSPTFPQAQVCAI